MNDLNGSWRGLRETLRRRLAGAQRPWVRMAVALTLMLPSAALSARQIADSGAEAGAYPAAADDAVARAWREGVLDRQRAALSVWFAERFDIPGALASEIYRAAVAERIEPRIAFGLVRTESSFRRGVVSHKGAVGYTQVLPSTAGWILPGTSRADLFHAPTNLRVGFRYLRYLLDYYDGDVDLALTAYNRGPGTVDRLLRQGLDPANGYARKVQEG